MTIHEATPNWRGSCERCGAQFERYIRPSRRPPRFCSNACAVTIFAGRKQTAEHINRRIKSGPEHPNWKGNDITVESGRSRAIRAFPELPPCEVCGAQAERHHDDGDTRNNHPNNIRPLCRRCHMEADGRLAALANRRRKTA